MPFQSQTLTNLRKLLVYTEHHEKRIPTVAFFTTRAVRAGEELCISYGATSKLDFRCRCGARTCRSNVALDKGPQGHSESPSLPRPAGIQAVLQAQ